MGPALFLGPALGLATAEAAEDLAARINAAIDGGRDALLPVLEEQLRKPPEEYAMGRTALSLAALLKAGIPSNHATVGRALKALEDMPLTHTYSVACYLFALDAYWQSLYRESRRSDQAASGGSRPEKALPRIPPAGPLRGKMEDLVAWLVRGAGGSWSYGGRGGGDLSNTQFAMLGLEIGLENNISIPTKVFRAVAEHLLAVQSPTGVVTGFSIVYRAPAWEGITAGTERAVEYRSTLAGWNYEFNPRMPPTSAMTAAGVSSLLIARNALRRAGAYANDLARDVDRRIIAGLGWMASQLKSYLAPLYALYSLEKVGDIGSVISLGTQDWYAEGASSLLQRQRRDGSWGDAADTALALLFLTRATRSRLQTMGPPVFLTNSQGERSAKTEAGSGEDSDLVYIKDAGGFVSAGLLFEFLEETREPKLIPMAEQAVSGFPPHRAHEMLVLVLRLWADQADPVASFARSAAVKLTGLRTNERPAFEKLAAGLKRMRELEVASAVDAGEVRSLLRAAEGPVLKRRLLDLVERHGLVEALEAVIERLMDTDRVVRRRAHEVLARWTGQSFPPPDAAGSTATPSRAALEAAAQPWRSWWSEHHRELLTLRQVTILLERIDGGKDPAAVNAALRSLVTLGKKACPHILEAMHREEFSIHLVLALEKITGKSLGLRPSDWEAALAGGFDR